MDGEHIVIGAGASVAEIQLALDTAPAGSTIELSAGTFHFDATLILNRSDISLVGAGSGQTIIEASTELGSAAAIQIGHALHKEQVLETFSLATEATEGASALRLETGHGVEVGDVIYLSQDNTDALFDQIGDEDWRNADKDLRTFMVEVTAVNGDTIQLASPLPFDFDPALTEVQSREIVENVSLSGLTIQGGWGEADPGDFSNPIAGAFCSTMIMVGGTFNADLSDLEVLDAGSHGITVADSLNLTATDISVDGAINKGTGGNGYGLWVRDVYDSTFTGLEIVDTRHAVVFASYTSAIGNTFEVDYTNRDINFHGGLDQHNIVRVASSIRTGEEIDYLSPVYFVNEGESYGAPTDRDANTVTFDTVRGTVRADTITASDLGVSFETYGGADIVFSGEGNDYVNLGSGHDTYYASIGDDTVLGDSGEDTAVFDLGLNAYQTTLNGDWLIVTDEWGSTALYRFETVVFDGVAYGVGDLANTTLRTTERWVETLLDDGLDVVTGASGWERASVWTSIEMGDDLNAIRLEGSEDLDVLGNDMRNHFLGNHGNNRLEGAGGNDRIVALHGDDVLLGGTGDDELFGGYGNDTLEGGEGFDAYFGGKGADLFVATDGQNTVYDFNMAEGDRIAFNGDLQGTFNQAFSDYLAGDYTGNAYDFDLSGGDLRIEALNGESIVIQGFDLDYFA